MFVPGVPRALVSVPGSLSPDRVPSVCSPASGGEVSPNQRRQLSDAFLSEGY